MKADSTVMKTKPKRASCGGHAPWKDLGRQFSRASQTTRTILLWTWASQPASLKHLALVLLLLFFFLKKNNVTQDLVRLQTPRFVYKLTRLPINFD